MLRKLVAAPLLTLITLIASPSMVHAVVLSGGPAAYALPGTTVAARPELAGTIIEDEFSAFTVTLGAETLSGVIQNRVVRSDVDNTLDFYWRIIPDSGNGDIRSFRIGGFEGFALDADWRIDGLGTVNPDTAQYFGDGTGNVNFVFDDEVGFSDLGGYEESTFFFLDTAALNYDRSGIFDLTCNPQTCFSQAYTTFAPSLVPVPAAVWLFGTAMLGLFGYRKRQTAA